MIVAHGSPSAPAPAEEWIRSLAYRVGRRLPEVDVRGATLAAKGSLERAISGIADTDPLIYPMFIADGWFVREALPARLARTGAGSFRIARPFGCDPDVWKLCVDAALAAAARHAWPADDTTLVIAAHGSPSDPRPRVTAQRMADFVRRTTQFRSVVCGFIDEAPTLAEAACVTGSAICLPFFAGRAHHVVSDVPEMLAEADFTGPVLDPIGLHEQAAEVIVNFVRRSTRQPSAAG